MKALLNEMTKRIATLLGRDPAWARPPREPNDSIGVPAMTFTPRF